MPRLAALVLLLPLALCACAPTQSQAEDRTAPAESQLAQASNPAFAAWLARSPPIQFFESEGGRAKDIMSKALSV